MGRDKTKPPFNTSGSTVPQRRRFIRCDSYLFPFAGDGVVWDQHRWSSSLEDGWGGMISSRTSEIGLGCAYWSSPLEMALLGVPLPDPSLYK
jgi:hypothetical protein